MDKKKSLYEFFTAKELHAISKQGSYNEELHDKDYKYFIYHSEEYSPQIYNHNYRISLERKLRDIKKECLNTDIRDREVFLELQLDEFKTNYNNVSIVSNTRNILEAFDLFNIELFFHSYITRFNSEKDALIQCLNSIVMFTMKPWHRTHISISLLNEGLAESDSEDIKSIGYYLADGDMHEEYDSIFVRRYFGNVRSMLSAAFINIHSDWFLSELRRLKEIQIKGDKPVQKEKPKFLITHTHVSLVIYLYLNSKNVPKVELLKYLPDILHLNAQDLLGLKDGDISYNDKGDKNVPESWQEYLYEIMLVTRTNERLSFIKRKVTPDTYLNYFKSGRKKGRGFNLISDKNAKDFQNFIGPIKYIQSQIKEPFKSALKSEISLLEEKKMNYF